MQTTDRKPYVTDDALIAAKEWMNGPRDVDAERIRKQYKVSNVHFNRALIIVNARSTDWNTY